MVFHDSVIIYFFVKGYGRMYSPGFCAKYCTYTLMDTETKDIVGLQILDKRQADLNSIRMEPKAFQIVVQI